MIMRRLLKAACVLSVSASAHAADLPAYEAPPVVTLADYSWSGAYAGLQAGYSWGDVTFRSPGLGLGAKPSGFVAGGYAGYNYQFDGLPLVIGVETDFNYADIDDDRPVLGFEGKTKTQWAGSVRARIGYAFDRVMVYAAVGVAYADRDLRIAELGSDGKTAVGYTVGGGVEAALTDAIIARADYRYSDYGDDRFTVQGIRLRSNYDEHRVMGGVAYKFAW